MAFKEVKTTADEFVKPKDMTEGQQIEGFLKSRQFNEQFSSWTYYIKTEDKVKGLSGCGQLDYNMKELENGAYIRLTYLGKEKYPGALQAAHQFKIEVDDEVKENDISFPANSINGNDIPL